MRPAVRIALLLVGLAGAAYCLLNAAGANILCLTEGCQIYSGYTLFGISFYWYGAGGFFAILLLALLHPFRLSGLLLWGILMAALVLEIGFLAYQSLFWPCLSCLVVALLFGIAAGAAFFHFHGFRRLLLGGAGLLWAVFFLAVSLATAREVLLTPWIAYGAADAPVKVFFSPVCPACRQTVTELLDDPEAAARAAFYPVAKNAEDRRRIAAFIADTAGREPDRLEFLALFEELPHGESSLDWQSRLRLLANKAALARTGASTVPVVVSPGLLKTTPPRFDFNPFTDAPLFPGAETPEGCSAFEEKPCD